MKEELLKEIDIILALLNKPELKEKDSKKFDYKSQKARFYQQTLNSSLIKLKDNIWSLANHSKGNEDILVKILKINLDMKNDEKLEKTLAKIKKVIEMLNIQKTETKKELRLNYPKIPAEIKEEVFLDIKELERTYNTKCYRASIILCGRIVETCLHRKYYEATDMDILEKNPGIGLGNLIAKLRDKGVTFDPGLTNQIHLINEVRIYSVHKKKEAFMPSQQQTYAMILYTMDVVNRMF